MLHSFFLTLDLLALLPSLPFDLSRPHQEGDAGKLRLAQTQIQNLPRGGVVPLSPQIQNEQIGTGECKSRGPSELESHAV